MSSYRFSSFDNLSSYKYIVVIYEEKKLNSPTWSFGKIKDQIPVF